MPSAATDIIIIIIAPVWSYSIIVLSMVLLSDLDESMHDVLYGLAVLWPDLCQVQH